MSLTLPRQGRIRGLHLVTVYQYTSHAQYRDRRDELCDEATRQVERAPGTTQTVIGGDFNAEVGIRSGEEWNEALGPYGNPRRTRTGTALLTSCVGNGWSIADSSSPQNAQGI